MIISQHVASTNIKMEFVLVVTMVYSGFRVLTELDHVKSNPVLDLITNDERELFSDVLKQLIDRFEHIPVVVNDR